MGYGSRALELLRQYYEFKIPNLNEDESEEAVSEIAKVEDEEIEGLEEKIGELLLSFSLDKH